MRLTGSLFSLVLVFVPFTWAASGERSQSIVIADFNNRTGDTVFDDALKQGLAMELGQSPFLNVLSDREVGEALLQMRRATTEAITLKLRQDVCLRTGSKALIGGAITNLPGERYSLELTAVACNNGDTLVKDQRDAVGKKGVLRALHQAASELRMKLGESAVSVRKFDVPAASATLSVEALSNYAAGIRARRDGGDTPAVPYLKRAIEIDPQFPLPYAELTAIYRNFRQPAAAREYAEKAYRLRDRVSEREKLKIAGIYYLATGDLEKEIQNYELWQIKYARDFQPYNNLGNDYAFTGQLEKSLPEYSQALKLMPSLISYVIAAFALARAGDNSRANALVKELKRDYATDFLMKFYWLPTIHASMRLNGGNLAQALKDLETAARYELSVGTFVDCLYPAYVRGQVYLQAHQADAAAAEFQKLLDHPGIVMNFLTGALAHLQLARAYATAGESAKAKGAYLDFLRLWKDADSGIPILEQAKAEYAKLPKRRRST